MKYKLKKLLIEVSNYELIIKVIINKLITEVVT